MSFENQSYYDDVLRIIENDAATEVWEYQVEFLVPGIKPFTFTRLDQLDVMEMHQSETSALGTIVVASGGIGRRSYAEYLYPNRHKLRAQVKWRLKPRSGQDGVPTKWEYTEFRAELMEPEDVDALAEKKDTLHSEEDELENQKEFSVELTEPVLFDLRMTTVGGSFKSVDPDKGITVEEVLRVIMGYHLDGSQTLSALEREDFSGLRGVDVATPDNDRRYNEIIIKVGTRLVDVPNYLQKHYGVYTSGIGSYVKRGKYYIYPLKDYNRFEDSQATLTIANVAQQDMAMPEMSYAVKGPRLYIAATGEVIAQDESASAYQNTGNGMRYFRSSDLLAGMGKVSENKMVTRKEETLREFIIQEREDGKNHAPFVDSLYTDNPYLSTRQLIEGIGRTFTLEWRRSNHRRLYPGMPVEMMYVKKGLTHRMTGTLLSSRTIIAPGSGSQIDTSYHSMSMLTVHMKPDDE